MPSAKSLGAHVPSALEFLVAESILPPNPPEHLYKWDTYNDSPSGLGEEELLTTAQCVVWTQGGIIQRVFRLHLEGQRIVQAVLTWFDHDVALPPRTDKEIPSSTGITGLPPQSFPLKDSKHGAIRALVVILTQQAHIYLLNGPSHVVHLPIEVERAFPAPRGLLLQRKLVDPIIVPPSPIPPSAPPNSFRASQLGLFASLNAQDDPNTGESPLLSASNPVPYGRGDFVVKPRPTFTTNLPRLFTLTDPLLDIGFVVEPTSNSDSIILSSIDQHEDVLHVAPINRHSVSNDRKTQDDLLLLTVNHEKKTCSVWHGSYCGSASLDEWSEQETTGGGPLSFQQYGASVPRSSMITETPGSRTPGGRPITRNRESLVNNITGYSASFTAAQTHLGRTSNSFNSERVMQSNESQSGVPDISTPDKKSIANRRTSSIVARAELATHEPNSYKEWASNNINTASSSTRTSRKQNSPNTAMDSDSPRLSKRSATAPSRPSVLHDRAESINIYGHESIVLNENPINGQFKDALGPVLQDPFDPLRRELQMTRALTIPLCHSAVEIKDNSTMLTPSEDTEVFVISSKRENVVSMFVLDREQENLSEICMLLTSNLDNDLNSTSNPQLPDVHASSRSRRGVTGDFALYTTSDVLDAVRIVDGDISALLVLKRSRKNDLYISLLSIPAGVVEKHVSSSGSQSSVGRYSASRILLGENAETHCSHLLRKQTRDFCSTSLYHDVLSSIKNASHTLKHPGLLGEFDVLGSDGLCYRYQLQLRPRDAVVRKILDVSQFALGNFWHCNLTSTWWRIHGRRSAEMLQSEWKSLVIALFTLFVCHLKEDDGIIKNVKTGMHIDAAHGDILQNEWGTTWRWIDTAAGLDSSADLSDDFILECSKAARHYLDAHRHGDTFDTGTSELPDRTYPEALAKLFLSLHILREEEKLNINSVEICKAAKKSFLPVLAQLGQWLGWASWTARPGCYYNLEGATFGSWKLEKAHITSLAIPPPPFDPPSLYECLKQATMSNTIPDFQIFSSDPFTPAKDGTGHRFPIRRHPGMDEYFTKFTPRITNIRTMFQDFGHGPYPLNPAAERLLEPLLTPRILETFPEGVVSPFRCYIARYRACPPTTWPSSKLRQIGREDIRMLQDSKSLADVENIDRHVRQNAPQHDSRSHSQVCTQFSGLDVRTVCLSISTTPVQLDLRGPREVMRIMFRDDTRSSEPAMLLCPQLIPVAVMHPTPGSSEAQFLEAQQNHAKLIYNRTMAVVSGQALLDYQSHRPLPTQKLDILLFNTSCRMQPSGITVNADRTNFVEEKVSWAFFHAGVQTGLTVTKDALDLDTSWLFLNKPAELGNRHAGLLMALGLSGHLRSMAKWLAFKYLTPKHDMTSIGLLLGWSASHFGSMDSLITRVLSVHLESLLPTGSAELNLSPLVQTAATMGIGILYYNSQHRRMSEKMLLEMEHVASESNPGTATIFNRSEGYRLAAGFALGFINLGKGGDLRALRGLRVEQRLIQLATGPYDIDIVHILDRATAGATIAVALIYMKTHNKEVARKIGIPRTVRRFDNVRPDVLLLRVVAKNLIMWDDILPRQEWIWQSLPEDLQSELMPVPLSLLGPCATILDFITNHPLSSSNISLYNILAGLCWSIALKHAGTADQTARDCLISYYDRVRDILTHAPQTYDERLTRDALMRFQHLLILAAATVMAGTGDLVVLKRARVLHATVNESSTFGFHQAAHMALGSLFIGQGRFTFSTTNLAIASLLCAFYPIFPIDVLDNRAHLQAFRHFWVFAAENRCILPRDVETNETIITAVKVVLHDGSSLILIAPALLPDLNTIAEISTISDEYWRVNLDFRNNPNHLASFRKHHTVFLRRKSLLAQYGNQFSVSLASRTELRISRNIGAAVFDWIFDLPALSSLGIRRPEACSIFPRGRAREERDKKRLFLIEEGKDPALDFEEAPPVTIVLDSRTTGIDDVLVLRDDVQSSRRDRLLGLSILFEWSRQETNRGGRLSWQDWIGPEAVEALRASVLRRMETEQGAQEDALEGDGKGRRDAMIFD